MSNGMNVNPVVNTAQMQPIPRKKEWMSPQYKSDAISAFPLKAPVKASFFYINDLHGQIPKMEQLRSAAAAFDGYVKSNNVTGFKVSSGDIFIGANDELNRASASFLQEAGIDYQAPGNHEFDTKVSKFAEFIQNVSTKFLGNNLNIPKNSPLENRLLKSAVEERNGVKYGFIGIQPPDLAKRCTSPENLEGIVVDDLSKTITGLQEEVNNLSAQGVDKIILLSHAGKQADIEIAQNVSGIDIINGGHTHDLIEGITPDINLFYSPKNEPVIITQAGREGHQFGVLNVEFTDGVVSAAQNNIIPTSQFSKNIAMGLIADTIMSPSKKIGTLKGADPFPENPLVVENPYGSFYCDAMKSELNADVAFINSGNLRGTFNEGDVTTRDASSVSPFKNRLIKTQLTEKEIVEALKVGAKSLSSLDSKPGLLQASGLQYTVNKQGELLGAAFVDKSGKATKIDVANPDNEKKYIAVYDDFYARGAENFTTLNKINELMEYYDFDKEKCAISYITKFNNKPFEVRVDGRIKVIG